MLKCIDSQYLKLISDKDVAEALVLAHKKGFNALGLTVTNPYDIGKKVDSVCNIADENATRQFARFCADNGLPLAAVTFGDIDILSLVDSAPHKYAAAIEELTARLHQTAQLTSISHVAIKRINRAQSTYKTNNHNRTTNTLINPKKPQYPDLAVIIPAGRLGKAGNVTNKVITNGINGNSADNTTSAPAGEPYNINNDIDCKVDLWGGIGDYEAAFYRLFKALSTLAPIAESLSVKLLLETPGRGILLSPIELRNLIDEINNPCLALALNPVYTHHLYNPVNAVHMLGRRLYALILPFGFAIDTLNITDTNPLNTTNAITDIYQQTLNAFHNLQFCGPVIYGYNERKGNANI